jgi:hypothetical protein
MKMLKIVTGISGILLLSSSYAGLFNTTVHSRANCLNNESITWWAGHPYDWRVVSIHNRLSVSQTHVIDTGFQFKDRVAAVHWGEGTQGGYEVWGYHYLFPVYKIVPFDTTHTTSCDIIEGWV